MLMKMVRKAAQPQLKRLGKAIRDRRKRLKLSQESLAERVDCHRNYVGSIERGEQNATVDTLLRFAKALNCSLEKLAQEAGL